MPLHSSNCSAAWHQRRVAASKHTGDRGFFGPSVGANERTNGAVIESATQLLRERAGHSGASSCEQSVQRNGATIAKLDYALITKNLSNGFRLNDDARSR